MYVPAQYIDTEPASLIVVSQDAQWYLDLDFEARAPIVFDNLIHQGEMPVTIGVLYRPRQPREPKRGVRRVQRRLREVPADRDPSDRPESLRDHG